jgi:hypothetical protein
MPQRFIPVFTMHLSITLLLALFSSTLAHQGKGAPQGSLYIADKGVGHRSNPIPRWRTSLRKLNTDGTNSTTLQQFGLSEDLESPVTASALSYEPLARQFYIATGEGIVRTNSDGSDPVLVLTIDKSGEWITSLIVHGDKLWYGTGYEGLLKRANLDGSGIETFLNVSHGLVFDYGLKYTPARSHADGIAIDEANGFFYWSAYSEPQDLLSHLPHGGALCRAPLIANTTDIEILVEDIWTPGQLRLLQNSTLYWVEAGSYNSSPRALKRAYFPPKDSVQAGLVEPETLLSSATTDLLPDEISSFAVSEEDDKIWVVAKSDAAVTYGRVLEMGLNGNGLRVLNDNVTQIGVPVGVEYVI